MSGWLGYYFFYRLGILCIFGYSDLGLVTNKF